MLTPHPPRRGVVFALVLLAWATASGLEAQPVFCADPNPFVIEIENLEVAGTVSGDVCFATFFECEAPISQGPSMALSDPSCDPTTEPCSVTLTVPFEFPGTENNIDDAGSASAAPTPALYYFDTAQPPDCTPTPTDTCGAIAICGVSGTPLFTSDFGQTLITVGGVTCDNVGSLAEDLSISAFACISSDSCRRRTDVPDLGFQGPEVAAAIGCPVPAEPPPEACNGDAQCQSCPVGGAGVGGGGPADTAGGPGATLRYKAGGPGTPGLPGASAWATELGTGWSYDYAQRIIQDPDASHVWLITPFGTFREFTDGNADGLYDVAAPSDEYRTLTFDAATGWELEDLRGLVQRFDTSGRWVETEDRNGNTTTATYDASGRLTRVDFPDGRAETFAHHPDGKLQSITEVGVDGATTRTWSLTWTGEDLTQLERPDGPTLEYFYDDPAHPGFVTRKELVGSSGGRRVLRAWEYDETGNVIATWRGDAAQDGPDAVDLHTLSYDDPTAPTVTTVTDPLGQAAVYSFDRDPASSKVRIQTISGDCPVCGLGPSSSFTYDDPLNPLLPTSITDGKGHLTLLEYDSQGQTISRTEAAGTALARTTTWGYDSSYPALVTSIERPSVDGGASLRSTTLIRDGSGNVTERIEHGVEGGSAFMLSTITTYEASGEAMSIDPPGFGTSDVTSFAYDASRGSLIPTSRTDPLIGTITFTHDVFNRRTEVTDPNGVTTVTNYDDLDRVVQVRQEGAMDSEDLVTENVYDEFGDLLRTVLPRGNVIEYGYDPAGRLIFIERKPDSETLAERTLFTLDGVGNRVAEKLQRWNGFEWVTESETAFTYTSRCHLDAVTRAPGTPEESTSSFSYDCNGNLAETWDENHDRTVDPPTSVFVYDELDRLVTVTQPWGGEGGGDAVTSYLYDVQDHLVSVTDAEGNVTTYEYSDRDRLMVANSPVSGLTQHVYNEHGELVSTMDARGVVVDRTVDELDRVTFVDYPGMGLDTTYVYDDPAVDFSLGRLTAIQRHGQSVNYAYDRFGRVIQDGELSYDHDKNGNRVEIGYPGGVAATYTYDFADRPSTLDVQVGAGPVQPVVTSSSYLPSGPLASLGLGNSTTETRTFDGRYAPVDVLLDAPNPHRWNYSTDGVGNILEITETIGCLDADLVLSNQTLTTTETFENCTVIEAGPAFSVESPGDVTFTAGARVVLKSGFSVGSGASFAAGVDPSRAPIVETKAFTYQDVQYFLTGADLPWTSLSWSYDQIGNRLTETRDGVTDTYAYAANATDGNTATLDQITLGIGGTRDYTFGAAGHLRQVTAGANVVDFTSDAEGRLSEVARTGASSSPFEYDGRSFLTTAGDLATVGVTRPVYSSEGQVMALQRQGSATDPELLNVILYFAGRPVAQLEVGGPTPRWWYFTTDHLGTPQVATDEEGTEIWSSRLEPFGEDAVRGTPEGTLANDIFLRLPGQWETDTWQDAALGAGVYYNVHRWYSPGTGRYSRPDPIRIGGNPYPYIYAIGRPLYYKDPLGLAVEPPPNPRDPFKPPVDPQFRSGPWGTRPDPSCCDEDKINDSISSAEKQIRRIDQGGVPTGTTIGGAVTREHSCGEGGWCVPWEPRDPFDPYISPSLTDPCVVYCVRVHEWLHFRDRRPWNLRWDDNQLSRFWEKPAYQVERLCLMSFL